MPNVIPVHGGVPTDDARVGRGGSWSMESEHVFLTVEQPAEWYRPRNHWHFPICARVRLEIRRQRPVANFIPGVFSDVGLRPVISC